MSDPNLEAAIRTDQLLMEALAKPRRLDPYTLAVAEKAVRDLMLKTKWADQARPYRLAIEAIHKLGEAS